MPGLGMFAKISKFLTPAPPASDRGRIAPPRVIKVLPPPPPPLLTAQGKGLLWDRGGGGGGGLALRPPCVHATFAGQSIPGDHEWLPCTARSRPKIAVLRPKISKPGKFLGLRTWLNHF